VIVVPTVLFGVVIIIVSITVTSICIYWCTKKKCLTQSSTVPSTEMPTIYNKKINNGTKDKTSCETDIQDEHIYMNTCK
jgi:hypothetical protein